MLHSIGNKRNTVLLGLGLVFIVVIYNFYALNGGRTNFVRVSSQSDERLSWEGVPTPKNSLVDWMKVNEHLKLPNPVDWSKIEKRKPPNKDDMHDKWIVVTSIAAPTSDVKLLSKIPGWKLLVVGDKKTPSSWE